MTTRVSTTAHRFGAREGVRVRALVAPRLGRPTSGGAAQDGSPERRHFDGRRRVRAAPRRLGAREGEEASEKAQEDGELTSNSMSPTTGCGEVEGGRD